VPDRILIIRPSALGDACRSVPVLVSLRRAYPGARIDWLVQDTFASAISHHPDLSATVPFARRALGASASRGRLGESLAFLRSLRAARYDLVLDVQGLARSGLFAWATGAPRRVGFANAREMGWLGVNERHQVPREMHSVDRMLELLRRAGVEPAVEMRLYAPPEDRAAVASDVSLGRGDFIVVAPTSRWPGKRWAADRFATLCARLIRDDAGAGAVVLIGSASERDQCTPLLDLAAREPRIIDRIGKTSIGTMMALIERSALVIANDSAALHMAVGFDRPLVALYGPTRVDLVGPYRRERDVVQHVTPADSLDHKDEGAGRALMDRITVNEVFERAAAALSRCASQSPA
jgi:lipopolysaccharide heptosyltransferase I